jgi:acyl-coenzyme A synthetase/AMP-(fatty) acid ligase
VLSEVHVLAWLAGFKCPASVSVVPELPRNATGKVLRSALREPFWVGRDRRVS